MEKSNAIANTRQEMTDIETMLLQQLGLSADRFTSAEDLLHRYFQAKARIASERDTQFLPDAIALGGEIRAKGRAGEMAQFLRHFAEHVASHAIDLASTYMSISDLVDHIPTMNQHPLETEESKDEDREMVRL